jgi:hypothetical protein
VEYTEVPESDKDAAFSPAFSGAMAGGLSCSFADLCGPCQRTVSNYLEMISKKLEGPSPDRVKAPAEVEPIILPLPPGMNFNEFTGTIGDTEGKIKVGG